MTISDQDLLSRLLECYQTVTSPRSGLKTPSYISIMLKYFIAPLLYRTNQKEEAVKYAKEIIADIKNYFGHEMTEMVLDPKLILLNHKFDEFFSTPENHNN